jgi:tRNA A-37 threonylcarbamoyl transferase component Bud32
MLALNFDSEDAKEETTIEDIINEKINSRAVKDIAKSMATKIQDGNNLENSLGYLLKIQSLKPIVFHKGRIFDAGMPRNPKYDTYVYDIDNIQILKIINCDCGSMESYMIIKELAYQEYAHEISSKCDFETPDILDYGRITLTEDMRLKYSAVLENYTYDCIWFILMNKMNYKTLVEGVKTIDLTNEETCNNLANKINTVRSCMEQNNLYHNDYHEENILIDTNNKIGIIDFGLADTDPSDFTKSWEYTCNKLIDIKRKSNLKSPTGVSNNFDDYNNLFGEYGGRRIRRRKTVNRRKTRRKLKSKRKTKKYKR